MATFAFGTLPKTKPTFGATSGTNTGFGGTSTATTGFNFGSGTTTTTPASTGFGFGTQAATTTASTGFGAAGFTGFGQTTTATTSSGGLFGFNQPTTTAAAGFPAFGTGGSTGFGTGLGGGLAGGGGLTTGAFGTGLGQQPQQATQQQNEVAILTNMATAVSLPQIFGDERDNILAKWNQLQAFWGTGKGFYDQQGNAVEFSSHNPFCRFKAVGYCCLPSHKNADGLVALIFLKPQTQVVAEQHQVVDALHKILGSRQTISVCVDGVKPLPDDKTEVTIYIQERTQTGTTKRITATEVFNYFCQPATKQQLTTLGVEKFHPKTGLTKDNLKQYLDNPPQGIEPLIWQQAKLDNPDPERLLPVPIVGFSELHNRLKLQEKQTELHKDTLTTINNDIATLQRNHANMLSKTEEYKRNFLQLSHRVLQVMVRQEVNRKLGLGIHGDEEQLRVQLENIQAELNAPTQFKGRLNELMSQIRMQNQLGATRMEASYQIDTNVQQDLQMHLHQQQEGLQHLISIIKDDLGDLRLIEQGLAEARPRR